MRKADVLTRPEARDLINSLFEEQALVLGGLVAVHDSDHDLVWRLIENLDVIRDRALRRLEDRSAASREATGRRGAGTMRHPAIEEFLLALREA